MGNKKPSKPVPKKNIQPETPKRNFDLIFLCAAIIIISMIRYRIAPTAFDRDEGEYGYVDSLILRGIAPFNGAYSMKLPGTSFMYAIFMSIFGHTTKGIHIGLLFMNAATMYILYVVVKRIFSSFIGVTSAVVYGIMAIGIPFMGFSAQATHFICFYSALALLFFTKYIETKKPYNILLYGLMFGMAFLMKQQAFYMITSGGCMLLIFLRNVEKEGGIGILKKLLLFGTGVLAPYLIVLLIVIGTGEFHTFWLWTIHYALKYESMGPSNIFSLFVQVITPIWSAYYYFWLLAAGGLIVIFATKYSFFQKSFVLLLFLGSVGSLSAGFYFRQHYFIVLLPAIGLLTGICIEQISIFVRSRMDLVKSSYVGLTILFALIGYSMYLDRDYFFSYSPEYIGGMSIHNPFMAAIDIAKYMKSNSDDSDKIAVFGSEPEIYFYSGRMAATGYLYTYPLMENQPDNIAMQNEMISEIEKSKPKYFVYCNTNYSWLNDTNSPQKIFQWGQSYTHEHYIISGFAYLTNDNIWNISLGDNPPTPAKQPYEFIIIFKRNPV